MIINLINNSSTEFLSNDNNLSILLDTGAFISVFTKSTELFKILFKDSFDSGFKTVISGFGGKGTLASVFVIPEVCIGDIKIFNLPVAIQPNKYISNELILSAYVFKNNPFTVDYLNKFINIENGDIWCRYVVTDNDLVKGFSVFTQSL